MQLIRVNCNRFDLIRTRTNEPELIRFESNELTSIEKELLLTRIVRKCL